MKAQKLIAEYKSKVSELDNALLLLSDKINDFRAKGWNIEDFLEDRISLNKERQIYFQIVKDLEDIN